MEFVSHQINLPENIPSIKDYVAEVEVLSPRELKDELKKEIEKMEKIYR